MKLIKDLSQTELIELAAVFSLRLLALTYFLAVLRDLDRFLHFLNHYKLGSDAAGIQNWYWFHGYVRTILLEALISMVLFRWTKPLSRLLTRGLFEASEQKPEEQSAPL